MVEEEDLWEILWNIPVYSFIRSLEEIERYCKFIEKESLLLKESEESES